MWEKINLPLFCERMVTFSIPQQDILWIMSWDVLFQVTLEPEISVSSVLQGEEAIDQVFDETRSLLSVNDQIYPMLELRWNHQTQTF